MKFRIAAVAAASIALAACGSNEEVSTEAEADTVEVAADEAMAPVEEEPIADPAANAVVERADNAADRAEAAADEAEAAAASVEEAGDNAAETAEAAMDAMGE
ncbi:MAG: hypothetical protein DI637_12200 [Citromicrobium sp.]|nr:MAG: hypothetical protein DI637_12200 [Citromicrobium sp.]